MKWMKKTALFMLCLSLILSASILSSTVHATDDAVQEIVEVETGETPETEATESEVIETELIEAEVTETETTETNTAEFFSAAMETVFPVPNSSFEDNGPGTAVPSSWTLVTSSTGEGFSFEVSDKQKYEGSHSLKIIDHFNNKTIALRSSPVPITPGQSYNASAFMYFENADFTNNVASIRILFSDENKVLINMPEQVTHNESKHGIPIGEWVKVASPTIAAPANARYAHVQLSTTNNATAVVYFDNTSIELAEPIGTSLRNNGFDQGMVNNKIPNWSDISLPSGDEHYAALSDNIYYSAPYSLKIYDQLRDKSVIMISDPVTVTPGDFYTGAGKLYLKNDSTASITMRFYDQSNTQLDVGSPEIHYETGKGFPVEKWTDITTHQVTAPDNAAYARLIVYTTSYAIAEAYYDDLQILHAPNPSPAKLMLAAPSQLNAGDSFTVTLSASRIKSLQKLDASLHYDSQLLQYEGFTPEPYFETEGASLEAANSHGKVNILASANASQPLPASSDIVQLHFKVVGDTGQAWMVLGTDTMMNDVHPLLQSQTILINIGDISSGKLDNKRFGSYEDLGAPIADTVGLFDGRTGIEDGINVMYTTVKGIPPIFHVINLDNNTLIRSLPLEGGGDVWSHTVAPNGTVYIAAGGQLWAYFPSTKQVEKVFTFSGETVFWALDHDEHGNIYIATGPGGKIIKYDPASKTSRDYGRLMGHISQEYVRSIAYSKGYIYGGTSINEIHKINVDTGEKQEIAAPLNEKAYVYDLDIVDDKYLIARFDTSQTRYIYDLDKNKWLDVKIENSSSGLHLAKTSLNGKIYMPVNGQIQAFNLNTLQLEELGTPYGTGFRGADWVEIDDPDLPGVSLITMNFNGGYTYYNVQTNKIKQIANFLPPAPSITHVFAKGNNGKIYITGMQASKAAEYDVFNHAFKLIPMGQAGSVTPFEDKVYFGVYPHAEFEVYEPANGNNPKKLFNIGDEQDRPLNGIIGDGKIFVANIPDYLKLGGAMMVYDPKGADPAQSFKVYRNIVQDQSIISLAYKNGIIYGSTNINGGLSSQTVAKEAKIFAWDVQKEQKIAEISISIPGLNNPPSIGGLSIGPDGLLWGGVNGYVFAIDPASMAMVKYKNLYPSDSSWGQWGSFHAEWSDGVLYMHLGRRLTAIDPVTLNHVKLADSEAFTIGEDGHIYFSPHAGVTPTSNRTLMYRMKITDLTHPGKLNISAPLSVKSGETFELSLYANQVVNLNSVKADLSYDPAKLQLLSVTADAPFSDEAAHFNAVNNNGSIAITASLAEGNVITADTIVAKLSFKAIAAAPATSIVLKESSASAFAGGSDIALGENKEITVAIQASTGPVDPDPGNPDPENPSTAAPNIPVTKEYIQIVSSNDLKASGGKASIAVDDDKNEVWLPANAYDLIGDAFVELISSAITARIAPDTLKQLQGKIANEQLAQAQIAFAFHPLDKKSQQQAAAKAAAANQKLKVKEAGHAYKINLSSVSGDGKYTEAAAFHTPLQLSFPVKEQNNRKLLGVYAIAEDGALTYIGGKLEGDMITVNISEPGTYGVFEWDKSFSDIAAGSWAEAAIKQMAARHVVQGVSETSFAPNQSITRAEFAAWIVRAFQLQATTGNPFTDVAPGVWYESAVTAAYEAGIINGKGNGKFAPTQSILREEMAVMIIRAYELQSGQKAGSSDHAGFSDQASISSWASNSARAAHELRLLQGRGNNTFVPKGLLTRAEGIQVIANLINH